MAPTGDVPRLRVSNRSIVIAAIVFAVTLLAMRILSAAGRVIGWMLVAAAIAGLLHPVVSLLARRMSRGAAAILVMLATVVLGGFVIRGMVTDVVRETENLKVTAGEAAREIEEGEGGFADFATSIRLRDRTERFMELVPEQLSGGGTAEERIRANATRGVAFLATFILSLFLLLHGPKIAAAAAEQVGHRDQRMRARRVGVSAFRRAFGYARGTVVQSIFAGTLAYLLARAAGIPGAGALAVWVAIWDIVPVAGAAIGATPLVVLGFVERPLYGALLAIAFIVVQVIEDLVWQPRLERQTMKLGSFLTVFFGLVGLELRGLTGALLAILFGALLVAVVDDFAPEAAAPDPRDAELVDPPEPSPGDMKPPGERNIGAEPQTA